MKLDADQRSLNLRRDETEKEEPLRDIRGGLAWRLGVNVKGLKMRVFEGHGRKGNENARGNICSETVNKPGYP